MGVLKIERKKYAFCMRVVNIDVKNELHIQNSKKTRFNGRLQQNVQKNSVTGKWVSAPGTRFTYS